MIRIAHLLHTTGIGGVETSADLVSRNSTAFDYRVFAFEESEPAAVAADVVGRGVNSPRSVLALLAHLRRFRPDAVVSSLWRSVIVGGLHRLRNPRTPWIVYVHSTRYTNIADSLVHRLAFRFADRILCDSAATLDALIPQRHRSRAEVVCPDSALIGLARDRDESADQDGAQDGRARSSEDGSAAGQQPTRIVYWGRVVDFKRLDRSLELMAALEDIAPGAFTLELISPESNLLHEALETVRQRELNVSWLGSGSAEFILDRVANASFFLQLSEFEGLAMAVREALALGLVPIVTPVGAIREYTEDGLNALHVVGEESKKTVNGTHRSEIPADTFAEVARRILDLSTDPDRLAAMSQAAREVPSGDFTEKFETALLSAVGAAWAQAGSTDTAGTKSGQETR
ncbi:glycosyltransferase family 4 protein [Brevibacterium linens]|uniref:glycosyltransferase family 4 protein n=1 Tax=Brevibacterium linens TaxID=1703 RepID=UPI003F8880D2